MRIVRWVLAVSLLMFLAWEAAHSIFFMSIAEGNRQAAQCLREEAYIQSDTQIVGMSSPDGNSSRENFSGMEVIPIAGSRLRSGTAKANRRRWTWIFWSTAAVKFTRNSVTVYSIEVPVLCSALHSA